MGDTAGLHPASQTSRRGHGKPGEPQRCCPRCPEREWANPSSSCPSCEAPSPAHIPASHPCCSPWGMFPSLSAPSEDLWLFPAHGAGFVEAAKGELPLPGGPRGSGNGRDGAAWQEGTPEAGISSWPALIRVLGRAREGQRHRDSRRGVKSTQKPPAMAAPCGKVANPQGWQP